MKEQKSLMKSSNVKDFIRETNKQNHTIFFDHKLFGEVEVNIVNDFTKSINLHRVVKRIELSIPKFYIYGLDSIYIGNFDFFGTAGNQYLSPKELYGDDFMDLSVDQRRERIQQVRYEKQKENSLN